MTDSQIALAFAVDLGLLMTFLGLVIRGRWRLCLAFTLYVPVVLLCALLVVAWPGRFYGPGFWMVKQAVYDVLKIGIGVELAWRAFLAFPRARAAAKWSILAVLSLTTVVVLLAPTSPGDNFLHVSGELHPRILNGTIWLLVLTLALAKLYRIPLHPFHIGLAVSLGAYLALFATLLRLEAMFGWTARPYLNAIDPPAYLALTLFWAYSSWRPETSESARYLNVLRRIRLRELWG